MLTPFDPLFVLLASSWHQRSHAMALSDVLAQDHNSWLLSTALCLEETVAVICDVQNSGSLDDLLVTANEAKVLQWLRAKVCAFGFVCHSVNCVRTYDAYLTPTDRTYQVVRIVKTLAQQAKDAKDAKDASGFSSVDANFVLPAGSGDPNTVVKVTTKPTDAYTADFTREAVEVLSDYLPRDVTELLFNELKYVRERG